MKKNERNIEAMTSAICGYVFSGFDWGTEHKKLGYITSKEIATMLDEAGYGNIEKALNKFADLIKSQMREQAYGIDLKGAIFYEHDIDNLLKEFLKNE